MSRYPLRNAQKQKPAVSVDALVGSNVERAMLESRLSTADLAAMLGLPLDETAKVFNGSRRLAARELTTIAEFFGKPIAWFFYNSSRPVLN